MPFMAMWPPVYDGRRTRFTGAGMTSHYWVLLAVCII